MAKIKLTQSAVDAAQPQDKAVELRDTVVPGFLCKTQRGYQGVIGVLHKMFNLPAAAAAAAAAAAGGGPIHLPDGAWRILGKSHCLPELS